MKAELKRLHSPDIRDLRDFVPSDSGKFSVFVQAMIGPAGQDSPESLDVIVCTPTWLADKAERVGPLVGWHHIVMLDFNYDALFNAVQAFCSRCSGETWHEIGVKLGRLGVALQLR